MIDLQELVNLIREVNERNCSVGKAVREYFERDRHIFCYSGPVKAKERPRSGKGGRMFTPPETRKFEKAVNDWAKGKDIKTIGYPIRVELTIFEQTADKDKLEHGLFGLTYNQKGDVDNLGKSILDGMNGVIYKDDKQITDLRIRRQYSNVAVLAADAQVSDLLVILVNHAVHTI